MPHSLSRQLCRPKQGQHFTVGGEAYRVEGKLGDGAVGLVRKATRVRDGKAVAIKLLAPDPKYIDEASFDDVLARFRREGERGAKLDFYSLLPIHAYVENLNGCAFQARQPQNPFLLMDRSTGGTLEDFIRRLHPSLQKLAVVDETRLRIAIQVVEGLEHLHRRNLVHRDVKPANIFLSSKQVENLSVRSRLGDFGVVKWGDFHRSLATGTLTATTQKGLGTMKYMSPEQALRPKDVTVRSDIFSLGATLFELFTGQILASSHHVFELMLARDSRGTTASRWFSLGIPGDLGDSFAELLLDMHRRGATGRPTIERVRGHLVVEYEERFGKAWVRPDGSAG